MSKRAGVVLFLVALLAAQLVNRRCLREYRDAVASPRLEVLTSGERVAAALLGGFRSFLVTILWVRAIKLQESRDFTRLRLYFQALQELQGSSPALFRYQANTMALDIPRVLDRPDEKTQKERWQWIGHGLKALGAGLSRYPDHRGLLNDAATIFERRFHVRMNPADRARYLGDSVMNPTGEDPLDRTIVYLEKLVRDPEHGLGTCRRLFVALLERLDLVLDSTGAVEVSLRQRADREVESIRQRVEHFVKVHNFDSADLEWVETLLYSYESRVQALRGR